MKITKLLFLALFVTLYACKDDTAEPAMTVTDTKDTTTKDTTTGSTGVTIKANFSMEKDFSVTGFGGRDSRLFNFNFNDSVTNNISKVKSIKVTRIAYQLSDINAFGPNSGITVELTSEESFETDVVTTITGIDLTKTDEVAITDATFIKSLEDKLKNDGASELFIDVKDDGKDGDGATGKFTVFIDATVSLSE